GRVECVPIHPKTTRLLVRCDGLSKPPASTGRSLSGPPALAGGHAGRKTSVSTTVGITRARTPLLETYSAIERLPQITIVAHRIKSSVLLNHFKDFPKSP